MKRWATILLNFIYFLAVTGVVIKGHCHCELIISSDNLLTECSLATHHHSEVCPIEHHDCDENECDGKPEIKKIDDWQAKTDFFQFSPVISTHFCVCFHCFYPQDLQKRVQMTKYVIPQPRGIPLYKLHGDFRFYG